MAAMRFVAPIVLVCPLYVAATGEILGNCLGVETFYTLPTF